MNRVLSAIIVLWAIMTGAAARGAEPRVYTDLAEARAVAAEEGKQLVVEFSGRAWCRYCKLLTEEVLNTPEFDAFAAQRVVVLLDYPRRSERTPEKIAADPSLGALMQHHAAYKVEGFPTVVLLDAKGAEIGRVLGYEPGTGAAAYIAELSGAR